ncbi:hypothetical protein [Brevibacillus marinus]|uniref:hypothetical protein n=1 Tax=Brevibacillus marinus TaxID=2496837 RepID=UPI000F84857C|nr:hypothetical protein [Brevibacillus marinus]
MGSGNIKKWFMGIAIAVVGVVCFNLLHNPPEEFVQNELARVLDGQTSSWIPDHVAEQIRYAHEMFEQMQTQSPYERRRVTNTVYAHDYSSGDESLVEVTHLLIFEEYGANQLLERRHDAAFTFVLERESLLGWKLVEMGEVREWTEQDWMRHREILRD